MKRGLSVGSMEDMGKGKEKPQLVFCCRAWEDTKGLGPGKQKEWRRSPGSPPVFGFVGFVCWFVCFAGMTCG